LVELRCNNCAHLKQGFCIKLKEAVPNGLAKLFYGGAVGIYSGTITYPSKCGIEKEKEVEMGVLVPESLSQELPTMRTTPAEAQSKESVNQIDAI
jgi:hypothetical protein